MHQHGYPHLGGTLPAGPIPDPRDLEERPSMCPSIFCTSKTLPVNTPRAIIKCPTTKQCRRRTDTRDENGNFKKPSQDEVVYHYVTLRSFSSADDTYLSPCDVPFLEPPRGHEFVRRFRDEELARMRDGTRDAYLSRDVARSECAKAQNEVAALKGIVSSLMVARGGAMVPHPPIPPAPLRDSVGPSQGPAKRPAEGPPDRAPLSPLTRAPINKRKKPPSPGEAAFLAAWEAEIHSKLGT